MPQRSLGAALLGAGLIVSGVVPLTAAHAAPCFMFTDPKDDGEVVYHEPLFGDEVHRQKDDDPDVDIVGITYATTTDRLLVRTTVDQLGDRAAKAPGDSMTFGFTLNDHTFSVTTERYAHPALTDAYDTVMGSNEFLQGGKSYMYVDDELQWIEVDATYDKATNTITQSVKMSDIEGHAEVPVVGSTFSKVWGEARADYFLEFTQDVATAPETFTWVGGEPCQMPAAKLAYSGATSAQYGDAAALKAKLTDKDGKDLASKPVTFKVGTRTVSATTGTDGVATATLAPGLLAGTYAVVASFAGDDDAGKVSLSTPFAVKTEVTRTTLTVKPSGTKRAVTAKVLDDDAKPVGGHVVTWYVNGKKIRTSTTSSTGTTAYTAAAGQTVLAVFNAVSGKYAESRASKKV